MKIGLRKTDTLYSTLIRNKRKFCEVCKINNSTQVHHYFGRRYENTRFDDDNIVAICFTCHRKIHEDPDFGRRFMIANIGEDKLDALTLKKNIITRRDDSMVMVYLKERIKNETSL